MIHRNKGRIVFPHVKPILEYMFAKSFIDDKAINEYVARRERDLAGRKAKTKKVLTGPEQKRKRAWEFYIEEYSPLPQEDQVVTVSRPTVYKMPLSPAGAKEILKWLKEDDGNACPTDVWIDDVQPIYDSIIVAANKKKRSDR